jgi:hypothetical protein
MALAHGYALPFVTQKVVGDYASDNAAATARAIASGGKKEAAGSCLDARAIDLQMRVPQRTDTNLLTNSAMAGATGSVLPTKWVSGSVNGLTVTISSAFTSAGFQAIDWTVSGTADNDGTIYIGCEPNDNTNAIPASIGQQYIGAMSLGKQAGTIPATMVLQVLGQKSSDGSVIETANSSTDLNGLVSSSLTRINTAVLSIASVSSDRVNFRLTADVAALDVISFTIRIAAPQVERNDRISPYITTTTGAASRVTGQPSLLIVPQLTKSGVVYPQLPVVSGADFTFTRATTATRVNASGLIESVASGVLRLDYPIGGGCPAALIEPSASNGILNSTDTTTNWTCWSGFTSGVIDVLGVSGVNLQVNTSGSNIGAGTGNGNIARTGNNVALASGSTYTLSFFIKKTGAHTIGGYYASITGAASGDLGGGFNVSGSFSSGSIYNTAGTTNRIRRVEQWGTDVYRCSETFTMTASGTLTTFRLAPVSGVTLASLAAVGTELGFAAPQIELSSVPTTFIPTTTGSATRAADVCTVSGVSGYIGQTEGTIYAEVDLRNWIASGRILTCSNGTSDERIMIQVGANRTLQAVVTTASADVVDISTASGQVNGVYKCALTYASGDFAFYVNGTQIGTDSSGGVPASTSVFLGKIGTSASTNFLNDRIRAAALYTTRLSNAQLAELTRL